MLAVRRLLWQLNIHSVIQHEQFLARILHDIVTEVSYKERYVCWLARFIPSGQRKGILLLVGKENLKPSTGAESVSCARRRCC